MKQKKIALVHDYLREYGGAERVLEELHAMFPDAPVYVAFVDKKALGNHWDRFASWDIRESSAAKIPFIHSIYSPLRLLAAYFFEGFDLSSYDVVISSTNMYMAKAVITQAQTVHICYIHTPPRSLYGYSTGSDWEKNPLTSFFGHIINHFLRHIDFLTAQRPDILVANSAEVQKRIARFYKRDSVIIHPPVVLAKTTVKQVPREDFYLYVNRLVYAKHPEIALAAAKMAGVRLIVVGEGRLRATLEKDAGDKIQFVGAVDDETLASLYARAQALLYPVEDEDFGIIPIEAARFGLPVIAHRSGGVCETVVDGKTGVLFDDLDAKGLSRAIDRFSQMHFDPKTLESAARTYDRSVFREKIEKLIERNSI